MPCSRVLPMVWRHHTGSPHAAHIVDRLAEDRELPRHDVMRGIVQSLGFADEQFVINPAMVRISLIGQLIVSGNDDVIRARNRSEILSTPGIFFYDRHRYATRLDELTAAGQCFSFS